MFDSIAAYYNRSFRRFGPTHKSLGWVSRERQMCRFRVLCELIDWSSGPPRLLDIGCGQGDLIAFLHEQGLSAEVIGVDVSSDMVSYTSKRFPNADIRCVADLNMTAEDFLPIDYVVASGVLSLNLSGGAGYDRAYRHIQHWMKLSNRGVVFNMLSSLTPYESRDEMFFYFDPFSVGAKVSTCSKHFVMRHDYLDNDVTFLLCHSGCIVSSSG